MRYILVSTLVIALSCSQPEEDLSLLQAELTYLLMQNGKISADSAASFFRGMTSAEALGVATGLREEINTLTMKDGNPAAHEKAGCKHDLGDCEIQTDIGIANGTLDLLREVRPDVTVR
jgi:hypothetical protein